LELVVAGLKSLTGVAPDFEHAGKNENPSIFIKSKIILSGSFAWKKSLIFAKKQIQ
jgi:hypothetical protein